MNAPSLFFPQYQSSHLRSLGPEHAIKTEQARFGDVNLMLSLKENSRGRFLRVSEKSGERFASLMIPAAGLRQFNGTLSEVFRTNGKPGRVQIDHKDFVLAVEQENQQSFLSIIENSRHRSEQVFIPAEGWGAFEKMMEEMAEISEQSPFPISPVVELPPPVLLKETIIKSMIVQIENKSFKLTLKDNPRGRWLRLTEKAGQRFTCLYVPATGLEMFKQMLQKIIVISDQIASPAAPDFSQSPLADQALHSEQLQLNEKMFDFIIHENIRGRYLRLTETSPGFYPKHVIIPSTGLALMVQLMMDMIQAANEFPMEDPQPQDAF
ncbi:MAG TPA: hypothetical protein VGN23_08555 [Verrucomicrobiae bacterium]|jgi:hypothetical protein